MKKLFNFLIVFALLTLTSCGGATFVNPDKDSVDFPIEGGEQEVDISADGSWEIAECPDWVKTEVQDRILVITTERNETGAIREGEIVLKGKGDVESTIKVRQIAKCTHITPESSMVEFNKEGGTKTVNIDTDGNIKAEAPEGFSVTYDKGVLTITAPANDEGGKSGEILLTGDEQRAVIQVTQEGNICPTCGGSGKVRCTRCGGSGYTNDEFYETIYGCSRCGGRGQSSRWEEYDYHQGSGRMDCPTCGGSGH